MIKLKKKKDCCGCLSCAEACPKNCIETITDGQGFLYPKVNESLCIDCGACENACPIINADNQTELGAETLSYACYNRNDEIRRNSSSGGFFTLIAEYVINNNGVVFGAKFNDEWKVIHSYTETIEGLEQFRRSKYVQSYIGESFKQVRSFLNGGRLVLFSGTPCQIAGLRVFLKRSYENLICLDFICHGVPSPAVWEKYLKEKRIEFARKNNVKSPENIDIVKISFRDKINGWRKFSLSISYTINKGEKHYPEKRTFVEYIWENDYMLCFLKDFINRPSCFDCKFRNGRSHSDVTMGDFWCVERIIDEDNYAGEKGTSLLFIHNQKMVEIINSLDMESQAVEFERAIFGNPAVKLNWKKPIWHDVFLKSLKRRRIKTVYNVFEPLELKSSLAINRIKNFFYIPMRIWRKLV